MAPDQPSAKNLAVQATWAAFREAASKMTRRQRDGVRLFLLLTCAKGGDANAAQQAEQLQTKIRCKVATSAAAANLKYDDPGLTEGQARCVALGRPSTTRTNNDD